MLNWRTLSGEHHFSTPLQFRDIRTIQNQSVYFTIIHLPPPQKKTVKNGEQWWTQEIQHLQLVPLVPLEPALVVPMGLMGAAVRWSHQGSLKLRRIPTALPVVPVLWMWCVGYDTAGMPWYIPNNCNFDAKKTWKTMMNRRTPYGWKFGQDRWRWPKGCGCESVAVWCFSSLDQEWPRWLCFGAKQWKTMNNISMQIRMTHSFAQPIFFVGATTSVTGAKCMHLSLAVVCCLIPPCGVQFWRCIEFIFFSKIHVGFMAFWCILVSISKHENFEIFEISKYFKWISNVLSFLRLQRLRSWWHDHCELASIGHLDAQSLSRWKPLEGWRCSTGSSAHLQSSRNIMKHHETSKYKQQRHT